MEWSTECLDWEKRIVEGKSLVPFDPLFPGEAQGGLDIFNQLHVVDMPGIPTMGEVSRSWITDFVASIFGAYDPETGRRMISEFFLLISKKNTKSTTAAGIMMTALTRNWRQSGEFLILAPTIEIANNSFFPARDMVKHDTELSDLYQVQEHTRTIKHRTTDATLKVVAADSDTVGGKKAIGVLVDELWLFGKQPKAENMLREACGGLASRPEGFTIFLSTQSDEPPAGVFKQKLQYARGVRDGRIKDKKFLPVLYEFPKAMLDKKEHRNPKNFYVTNPNLGASVDTEFLEREFSKSLEIGEESMCGFLAKHLNVEIGLALLSDRWAGADFWEAAAIPVFSLDEMIERCEVIDIGIDGGGLDDLLGFAAVGRCEGSGEWLAWTHAWAHPSVLERRKEVAPRLKDFSEDGTLTLVKRIGDDVDAVAMLADQIESSGKLDKIGCDPAGLGAILTALIDAGIPEEKIVGISQGWKMNGAIKTTERKLAEKSLHHGGQAMMAWCVGNARVEPRGNAVIITKQASGTAKIDPLLAVINAISLISLNPPAPKPKHQLFFV